MKAITESEYFRDCKLKHNNFFDYSDSVYKSLNDDIDILCPNHGVFTQKAAKHRNGQKCIRCANNYKRSVEELKCEFNIIHNNRYNYPFEDYENSSSKIPIECKKHGIFPMTVNNHKSKHGCKKCVNEEHKAKDLKVFIEEANIIHKFFYDYSKVIYVNNTTKIYIICPEHGEFSQSPSNHLRGQGCSKCSGKFVRNTENFIKVCVEKGDDLDIFDKTVYIDSHSKVKIKCKKHNYYYEMRPNNYLSGQKCPKCVSIISKPEIQIQDFLKNLNIEIQTNKRGIIGRKELDIYIPELKKAIEFNGTYWHYSEKYFIPGKHSEKSNLCREKGIQLLHIREDLWKKDPEKMIKVIQKFIKDEK